MTYQVTSQVNIPGYQVTYQVLQVNYQALTRSSSDLSSDFSSEYSRPSSDLSSPSSDLSSDLLSDLSSDLEKSICRATINYDDKIAINPPNLRERYPPTFFSCDVSMLSLFNYIFSVLTSSIGNVLSSNMLAIDIMLLQMDELTLRAIALSYIL